jgi:diguanylate cyclase (GGDEF)-like protein
VYATGSIVLVSVLLLLFTGHRGAGAAYRLLLSAAVLGLTASLGQQVLTLVQVQPDPSVDTAWDTAANLGLLAAFGLVAAAALHPSMRRLTEPPPDEPLPESASEPLTRWRLLLLAVAMLTTPAALLGQLAWGRPAHAWGIGIGSVVITVLVIARLAGLLRQVQQQSRVLAQLADTDPLTGLPNRRAWTRRITSDLARAARESTPIAVAVLDLDHFKAFNDTHGHAAGDAALRGAAHSWRSRLRAGDMLARLGGEEFAVLLPGATPADAYAAMDDLRRATPSGLTVSVGVAGHLGGDTGDTLLARADAALYAAKGAGRDRVHASPEVHLSAASPVGPA